MLTKRNVMDRWSVSLTTINRWMNDGSLPFVKVGKGVRFHQADVLAFEASRAVAVVDPLADAAWKLVELLRAGTPGPVIERARDELIAVLQEVDPR